jgi:hypothetical protein
LQHSIFAEAGNAKRCLVPDPEGAAVATLLDRPHDTNAKLCERAMDEDRRVILEKHEK